MSMSCVRVVHFSHSKYLRWDYRGSCCIVWSNLDRIHNFNSRTHLTWDHLRHWQECVFLCRIWSVLRNSCRQILNQRIETIARETNITIDSVKRPESRAHSHCSLAHWPAQRSGRSWDDW